MPGSYMASFSLSRSAITCLNGCAASSQPQATLAGLDILKKGGNAADAAVAMAAVLNVTEPFSTGLGGDAFCLFYDGKEKTVKAMNASGRSPVCLTLDKLTAKGFNTKTGYPSIHGLSVTVPGAAGGWVHSVETFGSGRLSLKEILLPAIDLARSGFAVAGPITSELWKHCAKPLYNPQNTHGKDLLVPQENLNGATSYHTPGQGEIFKNRNLAKVLELLAEKGKSGFYHGWVAESIVKTVKKFDGVMENEDLANNKVTFDDPISIDYQGVTLWETAPNSQGIVALIALNILKNFDLDQFEPNSLEYWHLIIESMKLAFADGSAFCADPTGSKIPISGLLSEEYGKERAKLINMDSVVDILYAGSPHEYGSDTAYFTVVDKDRNACSFINSICTGFGTGYVPEECGFALQNRGSHFSLEPGHPNVVAPNKRPFHTIIPGMITDSASGELLSSFGVMGGFMQPQGHVQVLLNMVEFGMNPQAALDHPRICINPHHGPTMLEEGIPSCVIDGLKSMGHAVKGPVVGLERRIFGRGQVIALKPFWDKNSSSSEGVLWAGCDPRSDGFAAGY